MKKIILVFALLISAIVGNAQTAVQTSKWYDNISVGVFGGAATPLDFNSVTPLNSFAGLKLQKNFTPVWGLQAEGLAMFNDNHFADKKTFVKCTNVGLNGVMNVSNALGRQRNRVFEVFAVAGMGWLHYFNNANYLTSKTGLEFNFNLGKGHAININPTVYWNLNRTGEVEFNKNHAQLALSIGYTYNFKTSNGTHSFKFYDVGAMIDEIDRLNSELAKKPTEVVRTETKIEYLPATTIVNNPYIVMFAKGSSNLSAAAIEVLRSIPAGSKVKVIATASPEGNGEFNFNLSQERANSVKNYLEGLDIEVISATGLGVQGETSNRVAVIAVQ